MKPYNDIFGSSVSSTLPWSMKPPVLVGQKTATEASNSSPDNLSGSSSPVEPITPPGLSSHRGPVIAAPRPTRAASGFPWAGPSRMEFAGADTHCDKDAMTTSLNFQPLEGRNGFTTFTTNFATPSRPQLAAADHSSPPRPIWENNEGARSFPEPKPPIPGGGFDAYNALASAFTDNSIASIRGPAPGPVWVTNGGSLSDSVLGSSNSRGIEPPAPNDLTPIPCEFHIPWFYRSNLLFNLDLTGEEDEEVVSRLQAVRLHIIQGGAVLKSVNGNIRLLEHNDTREPRLGKLIVGRDSNLQLKKCLLVFRYGVGTVVMNIRPSKSWPLQQPPCSYDQTRRDLRITHIDESGVVVYVLKVILAS